MSGSGSNVTSSDEDPGSVQLSQEKPCICDKIAAHPLVELLPNKMAKLSPMNLAKLKMSAALKDKFINQPDDFYTEDGKIISSDDIDAVENNFSPADSEIFKKFISVVLPAEPDEPARARIVKKLDKYCKLADPSYIDSAEFNEVLEIGIKKIMEDSLNLYFVLRDVKESLLSNRVTVDHQGKASPKTSNDQVGLESVKSPEEKKLSSGENDPENPTPGTSSGSDKVSDELKEERKRKIVDKLTTLLVKVYGRIKELEQLEVDFSDEEDSAYLKMQKYRERFCQIYEKLCTYTNQPLNAHRVGGFRRINFTESDSLEMNRAIEKWLNKIKQFPDYNDVNKFMTELNQSLNLKLTKEQVKIKAEHIFEKIGNMLQRRRHYDLWDSLSSFLNTEADPAVRNPELESILKKNHDLGRKREKELIRYYAEMQERRQLQPLEVPDEEADCSPEESGDEDENEIGMIEKMLDSRMCSDDDEEDSEHDPRQFFFYKARNRASSSRMDAQSGARVANNDPQKISVSNQNTGRSDEAGSSGIDSRARVHSEQTETVGTNIRAMPVKDKNKVGAGPNGQDTKVNLVACKSENSMKRKNENLSENDNDNDNVNIHPSKRFLEEKEMTEAKNVEETKITGKDDSDSDCEIIEIIPSKEDETDKDRKTYQVNYAFSNNTFNYNTVLSNNVSTKKHCYTSNYKNMKNQKSSNDTPQDESTNIRSNANRNVLYRENKSKRKIKNFPNMPKAINSGNCPTAKDSDLKNDNLATSAGTNFINCPLTQEETSGDMNNEKDVNKTDQNDDPQEGSSSGTAAPPPTAGGSSGGSGRDNDDNDDDKKPFDREMETEKNPENEDEEEDEDTPEERTRGVRLDETVRNLLFARTYQRGRRASGAATPRLPQTGKVNPGRRNSTGKQSGKPSTSGTAQDEDLDDLPLAARALMARQAAARKRKMNQNAGAQGTSRQGNPSTFNFQFQKGTAGLPKPKVNKPVPATSSARTDNVEPAPVNKKKRPTPVKPVQSDEEIVKNFLERSHPSISITTPKKRAVQNEPSSTVRQALETLSRLKGISATIVKASPKQEDSDEEITIISETLNPRVNKVNQPQKMPAPSATVTLSSQAALPKIPAPSATVTLSSQPVLPKVPAPSATVTLSSQAALPKIPAPSATVTLSSQPVLPKIPAPSATVTLSSQAVSPKVPAPSATATANSQAVSPKVPAPSATATASSEILLPTILAPSGTVTLGSELLLPTILAPSGTVTMSSEPLVTMSSEPLLPKIVTVQGNVQGFDMKVDTSTALQDHLYHSLAQSPQTVYVTAAETTSINNEQFYNPQVHLINVSGTTSDYNEQFYGAEASAATISGTASTYEEQFYELATPAAAISGTASTYEEQFYDPNAPAATTSGNASTYEDNFTGTVECIPIPRFRNVKSRSKRTPKKTEDIEYVIID